MPSASIDDAIALYWDLDSLCLPAPPPPSDGPASASRMHLNLAASLQLASSLGRPLVHRALASAAVLDAGGWSALRREHAEFIEVGMRAGCKIIDRETWLTVVYDDLARHAEVRRVVLVARRDDTRQFGSAVRAAGRCFVGLGAWPSLGADAAPAGCGAPAGGVQTA